MSCFVFRVVFVYTFLCAFEIIQTIAQGTCSYYGLCIESNGPGQGYKVEICLKEESCVEKYGHWSGCTKTCGGGTRYREGKCSGRRCKKVLRQLEPCSPQPCVTEQPDPGNPATSPQPPTAFTCTGQTFGKTFNDPARNCSSTFYICVSSPFASKLGCPDGYFWSQSSQSCQPSCDS